MEDREGKYMYHILICDDEKDIVNALEIYLSTEDINIFKAYNGEEAVNIVREHEIHLALLDIMMPVMDGIQALNEIRKFSRWLRKIDCELTPELILEVLKNSKEF